MLISLSFGAIISVIFSLIRRESMQEFIFRLVFVEALLTIMNSMMGVA